MDAQLNSLQFPLATDINLDANPASSPAFSAATSLFSDPALPCPTCASSLLFIDQSVAAYQSFATAAAPGTEVYLLDATQDAIAQITQVLSGRSDISSLHILSHGASGRLELGPTDLSLATLTAYTQQISTWATAFTDNADILLYGCNVAAGEMGQAFVQILSQLTQADVAASTDITGYDGNWNLEFQQGSIEAIAPFTAETLDAYQSNLFGSDYDNNGTTDLVLYNYFDGTVNLQLMTGATATTQYIATAGYGWQLDGMGDFDGNNYTDFLWHNPSTGETGLWLMNGPNLLLTLGLPNVGAGSDWRIVGVNDFDSNGTPDIVWRSEYYEITGVWMMNGVNYTGSQVLPSRSREWAVSGIADMDNNGSRDMIWRNTATGDSEIWLMNGLTVTNTIALPNRPTQWVIYEVADWNNDSFADLLWRNVSTGETSIMTLNSGNFTGNVNVTIPGGSAGWTILDTRDIDGNGTSDVIVRNYLTGENAFWMMNGSTCTNVVAFNTVAGLWDILTV